MGSFGQEQKEATWTAQLRPARGRLARPGEQEAAWRELRPRGLVGEANELPWAWAAGLARRRGEFARVGLIPSEGSAGSASVAASAVRPRELQVRPR